MCNVSAIECSRSICQQRQAQQQEQHMMWMMTTMKGIGRSKNQNKLQHIRSVALRLNAVRAFELSASVRIHPSFDVAVCFQRNKSTSQITKDKTNWADWCGSCCFHLFIAPLIFCTKIIVYTENNYAQETVAAQNYSKEDDLLLNCVSNASMWCEGLGGSGGGATIVNSPENVHCTERTVLFSFSFILLLFFVDSNERDRRALSHTHTQTVFEMIPSDSVRVNEWAINDTRQWHAIAST